VAMRIMWQAINSIKTGRAILLTTHSTEEASTLSDKAAILDRRLLAVSGTRNLVKQHGHGLYHVHLTLKDCGRNGKRSRLVCPYLSRKRCP
jgi:ABC-type multidrug transport system ATPase subunit